MDKPMRNKNIFFSACITMVLFHIGCSAGITSKKIIIDSEESKSMPMRVIIKVVFIPQNDTKSCATTSVAMAISHFEGREQNPLDKEEVWRISRSSEKLVKALGNDVIGLKRIADYYGYKSEFVQGITFEQLEYLLAKGILVVIFRKGNIQGTKSHAVLVTGYDRIQREFYVNDPSIGYQSITYENMDAFWKTWIGKPLIHTNRGGFIIYPKQMFKYGNRPCPPWHFAPKEYGKNPGPTDSFLICTMVLRSSSWASTDSILPYSCCIRS
jgi:hypothetical protein